MAPPAEFPGPGGWMGSHTSFCLLQLNYLVPATCCIIILFVFDLPAYTSPTNFPAVLSLFLLYGYVAQRGGHNALTGPSNAPSAPWLCRQDLVSGLLIWLMFCSSHSWWAVKAGVGEPREDGAGTWVILRLESWCCPVPLLPC